MSNSGERVAIALGGLVIVGGGLYFLFSGTNVGGGLGKGLGKALSEFTKTTWNDLGKPIGKAVGKGAVTVYNKALKPLGKDTWNKLLKPGYKQLTSAPKVLAKSAGKVVNAFNPLSKNGLAAKSLKGGANNIKKGFKKIFRF